jgi:NTP pyrophosphatase (non-canonical NTP hydrolase)
LAEKVRYLIDCIDDNHDPLAIMECRKHLSQTRTALAQPEPEGVGLSDDAIEADFRSWYNDRYHHHYFGAISLVKCIEWTRYALTRYARPTIESVPVSERWLRAVAKELVKAEAKHPEWPADPLHAIAIIGEEFGELTQAVLQVTYEPGKSLITDVQREAVQTAAMALRFLQSMDAYVYADDTNTHRQGNALPGAEQQEVE